MKKERSYSENTLFSFAYCGTEEGFEKMIKYLASVAEKEKWGYQEGDLSILRNYVFKTFEQCNKQKKILYSDDGEWCCTNTGLLTDNGKDILMLFQKNTKGGKTWYLKGFKNKVERDYMDHFKSVPELASYTDHIEDYYFNPNFNIEINTEHILDDNWERISKEVPHAQSIMKTLLVGVIEEAKIKVKRNMRLVVPQYYNGKIMYLMPIRIPVSDNDYVIMALAIERTSTNQYRANTIFTKDMAYDKARLLTKPESNWLLE